MKRTRNVKRNRDSNFVGDNDNEYYYEENDNDENYVEDPIIKKVSNVRKKLVRAGEEANESLESSFNDFSHLSLKPDHAARPIWVTPSGLIFLEAFSPIYQQAYDFLVAIAEPTSRPEFVHEYRLTAYSLYAAVAVSIDTESIINVLHRLCKTELPVEVTDFIRECTSAFGKAKLVLKENKFFVESAYPDILRKLLQDETITAARVTESSDGQADGFITSIAPEEMKQNLDYRNIGQEIDDIGDDLDDDVMSGTSMTGSGISSGGSGSGSHGLRNVSFMISQEHVQDVKRCSQDLGYPLMEEYDFRNDTKNPVLSIDLRPSTRIRVYQEKSLSKMFGNGRARSGIIVLPCGAGKTLTGVTATSTIKRATIILCINTMSVKQWKEQFMLWTTIPEKYICMFTSDFKQSLPPPSEACIVLTTYTMICYSGQRSEEARGMMAAISCREWGCMILDEVHVTPADKFRKVLGLVNAHCKLGLTATLVREDNLIGDLNFLVGPKLYEANWMDLTQQGYLANVQCVEVWCPMTAEFYREYIKQGVPKRRQELLYILNPRKFRACEYLVKYHEARGDKVIIFSDDVVALMLYAEALKKPYIYGNTSEKERRDILTSFKTHPLVSCIGLSKVGDTALDIPEANVVIQVSSHFGARRQEAQRLGRILRPKANQTGGFNAFFYTLVSTDTREMYFSTKRQQYLINQGYTFKVVPDLVDRADLESTLLRTKAQEIDLLNRALCTEFRKADEAEAKAIQKSTEDESLSARPEARRRVSTLGALSGGGDGTSYIEFDAKNAPGLTRRNPFFQSANTPAAAAR